MTVKEKRMLENYLKATKTDLCEIYKKPSQAKQYAFKLCKDYFLTDEHSIGNLYICTYNQMIFTCAYLQLINGKFFLQYFTRDYDYNFEVTEEYKDFINSSK